MRCKKIIIGFGSSFYSPAEIDFTLAYLAQPGMLLVGAVLNDLQGVQEHRPCGKASCSGAGLVCVQKKKQRDRAKIYEYLQDQCLEKECKSIIHQEGGCSLEALMQETRYADLLVLSQEAFFASTTTKAGQPIPVSRVLEKCGCPILVLPAQHSQLEQILMTFDGSASAMRGIKQFAYVLSGLSRQLPVTVLQMYAASAGMPASEEKLFIEYMKQHFNNLAVQRLCPSSEHTLLRAVGFNEQALLVVNNPSPENLPLLHALLHNASSNPTPMRLYTNGSAGKQEDLINA